VAIDNWTSRVRIPNDWKFTPEEMTSILSSKYPGSEVSSVRLIDGSDGTQSRARIGLTYAKGSGPDSVFVKTEGDHWHRVLHLFTGNLYREALMYGSEVELPLEHPMPIYGSVDRARLNQLVVMEDLTPRSAILNDATEPLSVDDVAKGLRGLAQLHSHFWRFSAERYSTLKWVKPWSATLTFRLALLKACGPGIRNLKDSLPEDVAALGARGLTHWWTRYIGTVSRGPLTLLHGDAHVGNTYLVDDKLGFLDWACVRQGNWAFDIGYFIIGALDVRERRAHQKALIEEYRQALDVPEGDRPTSEEAWLRYCSSPAYGLAVWVGTGSSINYQKPEICSNLVSRYGEAFLDLETQRSIIDLERKL
jgi:hypothetical protein